MFVWEYVTENKLLYYVGYALHFRRVEVYWNWGLYGLGWDHRSVLVTDCIFLVTRMLKL